MAHRTLLFSRFFQILLVCVCSIALWAMFFPAAVYAQSSSSHIQEGSTSPPSGYFGLQCGGERHNPSNFTVHTGNSYCNGSFSYVLTPTSAYVIWPLTETNNGSENLTLHVWAYIPTVDAGATVHYAWGHCDGTYTDLVGGSSVNQNNLSYWSEVGHVGFQNGSGICGIKMYSSLSDDLYMAEDALTFTTS